jgi:chromosomal replication initiator protein
MGMTRTQTTNGFEDVFDRIKERVRLSRPSVVRGWFRSLKPISFDAGSLCVRVQNAAQKEYLERFTDNAFTTAAQEVTGRLVNVVFLNDGSPDEAPPREPSTSWLRQSPRDPHRRWDSFAVGPCNRLAHAAATAVLEQPGEVYNPLFIWGPPGVGKTHLVQGLAARVESPDGSARPRSIWYVTGPELIDQLIESVEEAASDRIRHAASSLQYLLVDDVDTLANRERSQEEFFHLLNRVLDHHVQLILTASYAPGDLQGMPDRLRSRFAAGLVAGMDPPCFQTREDIVRQHARLRCIDVPDEVVTLLAQFMERPMELGGALVRLDALSQLRGTSINRELAAEALGLPVDLA